MLSSCHIFVWPIQFEIDVKNGPAPIDQNQPLCAFRPAAPLHTQRSGVGLSSCHNAMCCLSLLCKSGLNRVIVDRFIDQRGEISNEPVSGPAHYER
jgi:hypothetical protein